MIADDTLASIIAVLSVGVFQVNFFPAFSVKRPIVLYCIYQSRLKSTGRIVKQRKDGRTSECRKCGAFHTAKSERAPHTPTINSKTHTKTTPKNKRDNVSPHPRCCYLYITVQYIEVGHGEKRHEMNMHIYTGKQVARFSTEAYSASWIIYQNPLDFLVMAQFSTE